MGLVLSLKLKICQSIVEAKTLNIVRKRLSRLPYKVVEQFGVAGVSHGALRKSKMGVNRVVIPNVRQRGRLTNVCHQIKNRTCLE
jgi:hypothetical protein